MKHDDAELIERTLEGDSDAFAALVEKYQEQIHALAWQKIGDFHIAQEITQDAFITAYQKLATLTHYNRFAGWLYVITSNKCNMWHRKKKPQLQSLEVTDPMELEEVYYSEYMTQQREEAANQNRREIVRKLLNKLRESERTVVTMHYLAGLTCEDIGKFLGVSPNTIKSRLHRARNRLKKEEAMIKENLSSFQLPTQLTENIMKDISRLIPTAPSGNKPLVPLAISAASAIIVLLFIGVGAQNLIRFQKPYSIEAASKSTVDIVDTQIVFDSPLNPAVRNQIRWSDVFGKNSGAGQSPDTSLLAAANAEETDVSKVKPQWIPTKGPEGGAVSILFKTTRGDVYAGTQIGLYRLTDDGEKWKLINSIEGPPRTRIYKGIQWWPVVERQGTLYLATNRGVLMSTDRGETWKVFCECRKGFLVGMAITDGIPGAQSDMTIYLAYTNGVFRMDNAGKSWTPLSEGLTDRKIRSIATIGNTIFVGTEKGLHILDSDMWEQVLIDQDAATEEKSHLSIHGLTVSGHLLYVLAKKVNPNDEFLLNNEFHFDNVIEMKQNEISPSDVLKNIVTSEWITSHLPPSTFSLYRSNDRGVTWNSITPEFGDALKEIPPYDTPLNPSVGNNIGEAPISIVVSPILRIDSEKKRVIVHGRKKLYYSDDAGETWATLTDSDELMRVSDVVLVNGNTFYRSTPFGIHRSTDGGKSWQQFNNGLVNTRVEQIITHNNTLFAKTRSGLVHSSDEGESWIPVLGDTGNLKHIVEHNGELYASDYSKGSPHFLRLSSINNNLTSIPGIPVLKKVSGIVESATIVNEVTVNGVSNNWFEIGGLGSYSITDTAYYVEYQDHLFRWNIGTLNWYNTEAQKVDVEYLLDHNPVGIKFAVSGKTVYVGRNDGHLMQSFDEGNTWNDVTTKLPFPVGTFNAIAFVGNNVFVAYDNGVVRSSNHIDWQIVWDSEGTLLVIDRFAVDGTRIFGLAGKKMYLLDVNSDTWQQITPEIPFPVSSIDVDGNTLYVGTRGRGVLRYTIDNSAIQ